jgi:hypothetical protein
MGSHDDAVVRLLRAQHGVVTRRQAMTKLGMSTSAVDRRIRSGEWLRVGPATFRNVHYPESWEAEVIAACLHLDAVASHRTAARLWDLDGIRWSGVEVTQSAKRPAGRQRPGLVLHESTQMHLAERTLRSGIPATGVGRTLLDAAGVVPFSQLEHAFDSVLRRKLATAEQLWAVLYAHAARGRNGTQRYRLLLQTRLGDGPTPDSLFNRGIARLLAEAGLPGAQLEYPVFNGDREVARVDLAWPEAMLAIEGDSITHHFDHVSFQRDRTKRNELQLLGWQVLAFTWQDFTRRPTWLVRTVRRALLTRNPGDSRRNPTRPDGISAGG